MTAGMASWEHRLALARWGLLKPSGSSPRPRLVLFLILVRSASATLMTSGD